MLSTGPCKFALGLFLPTAWGPAAFQRLALPGHLVRHPRWFSRGRGIPASRPRASPPTAPAARAVTGVGNSGACSSRTAGAGPPWSEPVTRGGRASARPRLLSAPSLAGRGYMAATAAKREPRRRRCRQHSRRPEPTLGAVRGPRTLSMSRRSPVSVCVCVCLCVCVCVSVCEPAQEGRAAAPAPASIVCDPPGGRRSTKALLFRVPARPRQRGRLRGPGPRVGLAARPARPSHPARPSPGGRPQAPAAGPAACAGLVLRGFESPPPAPGLRGFKSPPTRRRGRWFRSG